MITWIPRARNACEENLARTARVWKRRRMSRTHEKARRRAKRRKLAERRRPQVTVRETAAEGAFESAPPDYCACESCIADAFDGAFENLGAAEAEAERARDAAREAARVRGEARDRILNPPPPNWPASWWRQAAPLTDAEVLDERRRLLDELALTDLEICRLETALDSARRARA